MITIPIEVSARHIHLSKKHADILFGEGYAFTPVKELSQKEQYAYQEKIEIQTEQSFGKAGCEAFTFGKTCDHNLIRYLGPFREQTQVELSWADAYLLGIQAPIKLSGELEDTPGGLILIGPQGQVCLDTGIIVAQRHIHCNTDKAKELGFSHEQEVSVRVNGVRGIVFEHVIVRIHPTFQWQMHIDTDEGNAAGIPMGGEGEILKFST
ncbi:MAG TPA: phosphate propanoyltransferase [Patescibacteria group bacterium]|nr:phosphate propanoyltransferase [Patescibacteria group bacterium]